jgi:hypothetical protein
VNATVASTSLSRVAVSTRAIAAFWAATVMSIAR